jgi:isopenicillin-N N-acyltransferase like protein
MATNAERITMAQPCRLIELTGTPHERGIQYGQQAMAEITRCVDHYGAQAASLGVDQRHLARMVRDYLPVLEGFDPRQVEEMRGIATGAGVSFEQIVLVNSRTELLFQLTRRPELRQALKDEQPDGCTGVVVRPSATRDKQLIHAHNWDWKLKSADCCVILRVRGDNAPDILTFTEAGALARFGFNSRGICLSANGLDCDRDYQRAGVPLALIRRKMLEQTHLALALRIGYCTPKSGSNNMIISHGPSGLVYDFECAPDETFMVEPQNGLLVHANHWLSPVALTRLKECGMADAPSTFYRQARPRDALEPRLGDVTVEDVMAAMLDDFESPWSICYPPRASSPTDPTTYATVATLIMRPTLGDMQVAMLPAVDQTFTQYKLFAGQQRPRERA